MFNFGFAGSLLGYFVGATDFGLLSQTIANWGFMFMSVTVLGDLFVMSRKKGE